MATPLLRIPPKETDQVDWYASLADCIANEYDEDPSQYKNEIEALSALRNAMVAVLDHADVHARDTLLEYFGQLELLELHFPTERLNVPLTFKWYDAFNERLTSQHSLAFEKASVIFNLAALFSRMSTHLPRDQKLAYHQLQLSAGLFKYIQEHFLHAPSQDLGAEVLGWLSDLMLAQAQEVVYEKTITEKKPKLAAKLAAGVSKLYGQLVAALTTQKPLAKHLEYLPVLVPLTVVKSKFFLATAHYQRVLLMDPAIDMHEMLARLDLAKQDSKEAYQVIASKFSKMHSSWECVMHPTEPLLNFVDQAKLLHQQVSELHTKLNKENDVIYHVHAMSKEALPTLDALILPEKLGFEQILPGGIMELESQFVDLFQKLIPMDIHEKNSLYSEKKSELLRQATALHQSFEQELHQWLKQTDLLHHLDQCALSISKPISIGALDAQDPHLKELWETFSAVSNNIMTEVQLMLDLVDQHVQRKAVPLESLATLDIYKNIVRIKTKTEKAVAERQAVRRELSQCDAVPAPSSAHSSKPESGHLLDTDPEPDLEALVASAQAQLQKLHELPTHRQALLEELKAKVMHDDIHELLILNRKQNIDQHIFEVELTKFQPYLDPVHANLKTARECFQNLKQTWQKISGHTVFVQMRSAMEAEMQREVRQQEKRLLEQKFKQSLSESLNEMIDDQSHLPALKKQLEEWLQKSSGTSAPLPLSPLSGMTQAQKEQQMLLQQLQRLQVTSTAPTFVAPLPGPPAMAPNYPIPQPTSYQAVAPTRQAYPPAPSNSYHSNTMYPPPASHPPPASYPGYPPSHYPPATDPNHLLPQTSAMMYPPSSPNIPPSNMASGYAYPPTAPPPPASSAYSQGNPPRTT